MLAAVMAFGEACQFQKVADLYGEIGQLPLVESRREHYARAKNRYTGAADLRIDASPLPSHLRHEIGYPDVWHVDLVEWEQKGSAADACADVILDPAWSEVTRRRATVGRWPRSRLKIRRQAGAARRTLTRTRHLRRSQLSQVDST